MTLSGYRIPAEVPNTIALNFDGGADGIPTFSLADLRACSEKGDQEFFHRYLDGKRSTSMNRSLRSVKKPPTRRRGRTPIAAVSWTGADGISRVASNVLRLSPPPIRRRRSFFSAKLLTAQPPDANWVAVNTLEGK
jgi:hypothetical protein